MDVFQQNYGVYYSLMCVTGLWPFSQSTLMKIQRICFCLFILCCIVIQLRSFFRDLQNDFVMLKNPPETRIFMKYVDESKRMILLFVGLSCTGILLITSTTILPSVIQPKYQPYWLRFYGFFYPEQTTQTDWVCLHLLLASTIGLLTLACTEASLAVFSFYLSGLFEIASYRIRNTIDDVALSASSEPIVLQPGLEIHQRALEVAKNLTGNMMMSYLLAILVVVVSFSMNLYRLFLAALEMDRIDNLIISFEFVLVHVIIMFLNNCSGQKLMNTSVKVFNEVYNSLWYSIPPKSQKMLLFVLMKSSAAVQFNLAGLFIPCYEGFMMMINSSFSYFTVLYSMQ
ncbi:uncharacterized protein LOC143174883 isoform X2 [Nomia melanderi]|uniref:uncharacterized protein LOC143174883 isoform X2 n=1 Tax=Nomia melanderi TaxID=2448451 RepID=UPI003FCC3A16